MIKQIFIAILAIAIVSCAGTKKMTSKKTINEKATTEDSKIKEIDSTPKTADNTSGVAGNATAGTAAQVNGSTGAMGNLQAADGIESSGTDYDQMYSELEMTEDQIRTFRSAMKNFPTTQVSKPNGEIMGNIEDERTRQLEIILSEAQFEKYQKWELNNKYK